MALELLLTALLATGPKHFTLLARFEPPADPKALGAISVSFTPLDPDVQVNQDPGPRLKLDPAQALLVDKQPPASPVAAFDPDKARYLDTKLPVRFPVGWAPGAPHGSQVVKASVTFFYCSKREGWCRKGSEEIEVPVSVP